MRVNVMTTHKLFVNSSDEDFQFEAEVDSDNTVRLCFLGHMIPNASDRIHTLWLGRADLLAIRALVNKALDYVVD